MRTQFSLAAFVVMISMLILAACSPAAAQPAATQAPAATQPPVTQAPAIQQPVSQAEPTDDPNTEVVLSMIERLNAGDVEGSLAYFADDAVAYLMGFPPTGIEVYPGKETIRQLWEDSASNHFEWQVDVQSVAGDMVNIRAKTWHDFTRQLGIAPLEYIDVYEIQDGKIVTYGSWLTDESLARFRPAFAEAVPPEPTATPSEEPAVSEMTVTIAGGTCTSDSAGPLQAGEVTVHLNVEDQANSLYALTLFNLDPGKDVLDLMISTAGMPPSWLDILLMEELGPGKNATYTFTVEQGPVYMICWSKPPDLPIGNAGPFEVKPTAATVPAPERGESDILVTFADNRCSYEGPPVLPAGSAMVILNLQSQKAYSALTFFTLDPGYDLKDLVDSSGMSVPPDWAKMIFMHEANPGEVAYHELTTETGPLYYLCWSADTERAVGSGGPLEVAQK